MHHSLSLSLKHLFQERPWAVNAELTWPLTKGISHASDAADTDAADAAGCCCVCGGAAT